MGRGCCGARRDFRGAQQNLRRGSFTAVNHTPPDFLRSASGAEMVVSKLERLAQSRHPRGDPVNFLCKYWLLFHTLHTHIRYGLCIRPDACRRLHDVRLATAP